MSLKQRCHEACVVATSRQHELTPWLLLSTVHACMRATPAVALIELHVRGFTTSRPSHGSHER